jgi:hypothetical protein
MMWRSVSFWRLSIAPAITAAWPALGDDHRVQGVDLGRWRAATVAKEYAKLRTMASGQTVASYIATRSLRCT